MEGKDSREPGKERFAHGRAKPRRPVTPFVTRRAGSSHSSPTLLVTLLPQLPPLLLLARPAYGASPTICGAFHVSSQQPLYNRPARVAKVSTTSLLASRLPNAVAPSIYVRRLILFTALLQPKLCFLWRFRRHDCGRRWHPRLGFGGPKVKSQSPGFLPRQARK
jgi:hypothetical protein